jgi:hypothetical protein
MPDVTDELERARGVYDQLHSLQSNPVNQERIDAETERINQTVEDRNKVFAKAREIYEYKDKAKEVPRYKPLVDRVFPDGNDDARRKFRKEYEKAMGKLFESFVARSTATNPEIKLMKDKIENESAAGGEGGGLPGRPRSSQGPRTTAAGVVTEAGARLDPTTRANVAVAQKIYCYAVHFNTTKGRQVSSIDFDPMMEDIGTMDAPTPEEVWRAQLNYWIQKDVVEAIVAVNKEAADELSSNRVDPWVGLMPIKDVISIRVSDYIVEDEDGFAGAPAGGETEALPCGTANTVFTHSRTGGSADVVQFTVKLVMDQRDILRLVNKLSKNSFHTLLRVAYETIPPNREMHGKIYGSEPTVNVVMDFETHMLAEVFRALMPQAVCDNYDAIDCDPYRDEEDEEDEEEG